MTKEPVAKLLCPGKSMILRPFARDHAVVPVPSTRPTPCGLGEAAMTRERSRWIFRSAEQVSASEPARREERKWPQKGDFNGQMSFATGSSLYLIELNQVPILEQLHLEEALLRTDSRNFCILNRGAPPSIVLGCSSNPQELLDLERVQKQGIPLIQRFSGGGCVLIDQETFLCSFLFSKETLDVSPFPEPILRWGADLYQKAWNIPGFSLCEQDYAIGDRKCGGNAQYIQKDRWLLHTSFLWNFQNDQMSLLQMPKKRPLYRKDRSHAEFLCCLKDHFPSQETLIARLKNYLTNQFSLFSLLPEEGFALCQQPHRRSTKAIVLP